MATTGMKRWGLLMAFGFFSVMKTVPFRGVPAYHRNVRDTMGKRMGGNRGHGRVRTPVSAGFFR